MNDSAFLTLTPNPVLLTFLQAHLLHTPPCPPSCSKVFWHSGSVLPPPPTWILLVTAMIFCSPAAMDHAAQEPWEYYWTPLPEWLWHFFATIGGTSFIAPAMDLLYPFALSPADAVLTTVCSTNIASFTLNVGIAMGHDKQEGEHSCSWICCLTLNMVQHNCSAAAKKIEWSLGWVMPGTNKRVKSEI